MSVYVNEDAGGYPIADVRETYIAGIEASAAAALGPSRALVDDSPARAIAVNLADAFASVGPLFELTLAFRSRIQHDGTTRPEILRGQWQQFGQATNDRCEQTRQTIATGIDELEVALKAESVPMSTDPAAVLVARQEIELALRASKDADLPFQVLLEQAGRGGDVAACAASEWGRLLLAEANQDGDAIGFAQVVDAAIQTALTGPDERKRRAAAALIAARAPFPGTKVAAIRLAQAYAAHVLGVIIATTARGVVLYGPAVSPIVNPATGLPA